MTLSLIILAVVAAPSGVVMAGILFALGYSVTLPTVVVWAAQTCPPAEQGRSTALVNTVFNIGGVIGPLLGGFAIPVVGFSWVLWH
jgi:MFS family permease